MDSLSSTKSMEIRQMRDEDELKEECIRKLTEAIDSNCGIAPAIAQQYAEMLVEYYGAYERDRLGFDVGDHIYVDDLPFEITAIHNETQTLEAKLKIQ